MNKASIIRTAVLTAVVAISATGCVEREPLTPEQARAQQIEEHCENVAATARASLQAQQELARQDQVSGGFWQGAAEERDRRAAYDAAYAECFFQFTGQLPD